APAARNAATWTTSRSYATCRTGAWTPPSATAERSSHRLAAASTSRRSRSTHAAGSSRSEEVRGSSRSRVTRRAARSTRRSAPTGTATAQASKAIQSQLTAVILAAPEKVPIPAVTVAFVRFGRLLLLAAVAALVVPAGALGAVQTLTFRSGPIKVGAYDVV